MVFFTTYYHHLQAQSFFHNISGIGKATTVDELGNIYVAGYFSNTMTLGTTTLESAGGQDIFIAKYDATGTPLWAKRAGGTATDQALGIAVSSSAVYITGIFYGTANFNTPSATGSNEIIPYPGADPLAFAPDMFIAKYDLTGSLQWVKRAGSSNPDVGTGIAVSGNDVYVTGSFQGTANFNTPWATGSNEITSAGINDIFIAKYDNTGALIWVKRAGGSNADAPSCIAISGTSLYIAGYITGTANFISTSGTQQVTSVFGRDAFIAKFDDTGDCQWARRAGANGGLPPLGSVNDEAYAIAASGSAVYITGYFAKTANFNTSPLTSSITITSAGNSDIFLAKYDDTGILKWATRAGGTGLDLGYGVAVSGTSVYITGCFSGTANFNTPSATSANTITSVGSSDIVLAKYEDLGTSGVFQWARRAGDIGLDYGYGVTIAGSNVYVTGEINGIPGFFANNLICTPSVVINANPSGTITPGTSVVFTATPTDGNTPTYQWQKNNVVVGTNSATYTDNMLANNDVIKCVIMSTDVCSYTTSSNLTMSVSGVMPVELLDFSGKYTEGGNLLTWTTAHEVNNKGFQVERRKATSDSWDILGFKTVAPQAPKGALYTYDFLDVAPPLGAGGAYYRLRQLDNDGKEMFSKIISVEHKGYDKLKVYPNPVTDVLTIGANTEGVDFQILNLLGQQVLSGKATQRIDVSALPQGTYFMKVGVEQVKFVKQ